MPHLWPICRGSILVSITHGSTAASGESRSSENVTASKIELVWGMNNEESYKARCFIVRGFFGRFWREIQICLNENPFFFQEVETVTPAPDGLTCCLEFKCSLLHTRAPRPAMFQMRPYAVFRRKCNPTDIASPAKLLTGLDHSGDASLPGEPVKSPEFWIYRLCFCNFSAHHDPGRTSEANRRAGKNVNTAEADYGKVVSHLLKWVFQTSGAWHFVHFLTFRTNAVCPFGDWTAISRK